MIGNSYGTTIVLRYVTYVMHEGDWIKLEWIPSRPRYALRSLSSSDEYIISKEIDSEVSSLSYVVESIIKM